MEESQPSAPPGSPEWSEGEALQQQDPDATLSTLIMPTISPAPSSSRTATHTRNLTAGASSNNKTQSELAHVFSTVVARGMNEASDRRNARKSMDRQETGNSMKDQRGFGDFATFGRKGLGGSSSREAAVKVPFRDDSGVAFSYKAGHSYSTVVRNPSEGLGKERGASLLKKRGHSEKRESEGRGKVESAGATAAVTQDSPNLPRHPRRKSSPVHDNVICEDPSLKYELLNELGIWSKLLLLLVAVFISFGYRAIQSPAPTVCGSPEGPPVTAPRVQLRDGHYLAYKEACLSKEKATYKF